MKGIISLVFVLSALCSSAINIQIKLLKSHNITTDKDEFSKIELKWRDYEVTVSCRESETNAYKIVVGTVVSSAKTKNMYFVLDYDEEEFTPSNKSKKAKFKVQTCTVHAEKDMARGSCGIDLNDGYQIDGIIVEVKDEKGGLLKRKSTNDTKYQSVKVGEEPQMEQSSLKGFPIKKETTIERIDSKRR